MAAARTRGDSYHHMRARHFTYDKWLENEGVPSITGHFVADLRELEVHPWPRMGGRGVFLNLSAQEVTDAYVMELPPAANTPVQHHLFEAVLYVLGGNGATSVWNEGQKPISFEWQEGSMFAIPLNARYQHFNASGASPARLFAVTSAPLTMNLYQNEDFIFNCPYVFSDRFNGGNNYFNDDLRLFDGYGGDELIPGEEIETNFVADLRRVEIPRYKYAGPGVQRANFWLANTTMRVHKAVIASGTYRKGHRHGPGAHLYMLGGSGYTLLWRDGEEPKRFDWHEGSFLSPPGAMWHENFNTSVEPVSMVGLHRAHAIPGGGERDAEQIEYYDELPWIRQIYEEALAKNGLTSKMDPKLYAKPGPVAV
jgi:uncharacterized RmlC-like cupin family protein